jgi:hypothetical protein
MQAAETSRDLVRQSAVIGAFVAVVVVNALANALPLNGQTTGEIANRLLVFTIPAGFSSIIWGVIYLFLAGYTAYQGLPSQREDIDLRRIAWLFLLASAANIAWLFLWHFQLFTLSLVAMLALLGSLIAIYLILGIGRRRAGTAKNWTVHVPFSTYLGWITLATIANAAIVLSLSGWNGFGLSGRIWAGILIAVAALINLAVIATRTDVAFTLVILWSFAGIAARQVGEPIVFAAAIGASFAVGGGLLMAVLQEKGIV